MPLATKAAASIFNTFLRRKLMLKKIFALTLVGCFISGSVWAQSSSGVRAFQQGQDSWKRQGEQGFSLVSNFSRQLDAKALNNILNAEMVFCYNVGSASRNYNGYTLDGFAINGFCGIVQNQLKSVLMQQLFGTSENVNFTTSEQCTINPRIMLRFIRGVDSTDVLLSAPCYSMAVFYAGKTEIFNFSPSGQIIDAIVNGFDETQMRFSSPAALKQVVPIGVSSTTRSGRGSSSQAKDIFGSSSASGGTRTQGGWNNLR